MTDLPCPLHPTLGLGPNGTIEMRANNPHVGCVGPDASVGGIASDWLEELLKSERGSGNQRSHYGNGLGKIKSMLSQQLEREPAAPAPSSTLAKSQPSRPEDEISRSKKNDSNITGRRFLLKTMVTPIDDSR